MLANDSGYSVCVRVCEQIFISSDLVLKYFKNVWTLPWNMDSCARVCVCVCVCVVCVLNFLSALTILYDDLQGHNFLALINSWLF